MQYKNFPANIALERGIYSSRFKNEVDRFVAIFSLFTPELKQKLFKPEIAAVAFSEQRDLFDKILADSDPEANSLNRLLYLDTRSLLPDSLLLFNDKITMAHSIENRVPFLDMDLVAFLLRVFL